MAKPWAEVESSEQYRALGEPEQQAVRTQYFDAVVAPNVATQDLDTVRAQFMREAGPSMGKSIGRAAKAAASGVADFIAPRIADVAGDEVDDAPIKTDADAPAPAAPASLMASAEGSRGNGMGREAVARVIDAPDSIRAPQLSADYGFREAAGDLRRAQAAQDRATEARAVSLRTGADAETARSMQTGADAAGLTGGNRADALFRPGAVKQSDFDWDAREQYKDAHTVTRGLAKGGQVLKQQGAGLALFLAENVPGDFPAIESAARGAHEAAGKRMEGIGEQGDRLTRNFEGALASVLSNAPGLAVGVASGGTAVPLMMMGSQVFGDEYAQGRRAGLTQGAATTRAAAMGAAEIVGERLGLGHMIQGLRAAGAGKAPKEVIKFFAQSISREVPGEQLTTALQFGTDKFLPVGLTPEATLEQYLQQASDTLVQTVMQSGMMVGGGMGVNAGMRRLAGRDNPQEEAPNDNTAGLATGSGGQSGPVGTGSAGDTAGDGIGAANPGQPGNGGVAGIDVAGSEPAVPVGTGGVTDAALTGDGSGLADAPIQEAPQSAQSVQSAPAMPAFAAGAQPTATAPLAQQPAAMNLPPELAARVAQIDARTAEIVAEAPTRSGPVQASLTREAAKLERERGEIAAQAPIIEPEIIADNSPAPATVKDSLTPQPDPARTRFDAHADDLRAMAQDAGWAEQGGKLIRNPDGSMARTRWIPRAEWFMAGMEGDPSALAAAIEAQSRGERVPAKARRTIEGMMEWIEAQQTGAVLDEDASVFDLERASYNEASDGERAAFDMLDDVFALDAMPNDADTAAGMRALGFTDEEINGLANPQGTDGQGQGRIEQADARGTGERAADVRGSDEAPRQAQGESSSEVSADLLTSYTPAELARREQAARDAQAREAAEQQAREQKAQADAERDTFALTGSDRSADVLAAQGQGGLFDVAAGAPQGAVSDTQTDSQKDTKKAKSDSHAAKRKKKTAGQRVGLKVGDTVTFSANIDYLTAGTPYVVEQDGKDSIYFRNPANGGGTSVRANMIEAWQQAGRLTMEVVPARDDARGQSAPAEVAETGAQQGVQVDKKADTPTAKSAEESAKYLKDFVYSLSEIEGMHDRAMVALSGDLGKSGRDTLLMRAYGISRGEAHDINNRLDSRKPHKLRREDLQEAFSIFPGLRDVVEKAIRGESASAKSDTYGAKNKLVSSERAAELRARLKSKLTQLNSGIDPEMLAIGTELAAYHIEAGARRFVDFARAVAADLDTTIDRIRPYLRGWYNGARDMIEDAGMPIDGMDGPEQVREALATLTTDTAQEQGNVTDQRSGTDLERDRGDADPQDGVGAQGVRAGRGGDGGTGGRGVPRGEGEARAGRGGELDGHEAAAAGERGNLALLAGEPADASGAAGGGVDQRSVDAGLDGPPVEPSAAGQIESLARSDFAQSESRVAQRRADKEAHTGRTLDEVRAALPSLLPGQQEDVFTAETRFAKPDGYGMLFTNGTGTGKTYLGAGVVKRHVNAGKDGVLIVAPSDKIIDDWIKTLAALNVPAAKLENTRSAGRGVVVTTYANFGDNAELARRDWDLIVTDEAHYLIQSKDGDATSRIKAMRALSLHPDGALDRHAMLYADLIERARKASEDAKLARMSDDERDWAKADALQAKADKLYAEIRRTQDEVKADVMDRQGEARTRALFLSATPFAYEKTVDWANGYLFDYNEGQPSEKGSFRGYNDGSNRDRFFMQHFGYRMRYNKLTQPGPEVDSGLMQRQFNSWLKKRGVLSSRALEVDADYDRRFVLAESAVGTRIDAALAWFKDEADRLRDAGQDAAGVNALRDTLAERFDYQSRRYLLEAIKAREVLSHVREHMAMGRKVVVFHDYKKGGGFNPFVFAKSRPSGENVTDAVLARAEQYNAAIDAFNAKFRDLVNADFAGMPSPIEVFQREIPGVLLFNGDVPAKKRRENVAKFQDDASGPQVILVQSAAGKEGISLHDTTGKHPRVLFNLGQPTQPTTAIQQEGRIYRTGQKSNAMFRYLNTGTNWEKWAFATTIAQRASAAENLGQGEQARALKDAFITAFEESDAYRAGMEDEGTGGKERDRAANEALSEYDRARAFYFGTQKKTSRTKAQEGEDYFATPEPVGLKMVEWADIRGGESVLEPSAGHGAIARWMPDSVERTAVEPSPMLLPRLAMVFDGKIVDDQFENLNVVNKYDAVVMNPPFGSGGKLAFEHVAKAATHLRNGGRIVALVPTGPAADKRFEQWFYETEQRPVKPLFEHPTLGAIYRGDTITFDAWGAQTDIKVWSIHDTGGAQYAMAKGADLSKAINLVAAGKIERTGPRTTEHRPAADLHLVADIKLPSVTFERAGTAVSTRVLVIEKQADEALAAKIGQANVDLTGIEQIGELFDRFEGLGVAPRTKPQPAADAVQAADEKFAANQARNAAKAPVDTAQTEAAAEAMGLKIVEHTTQKGKVLRGVVRTDLNKAQAQEIDPYTFKKDGGWFVREKHLAANEPGAVYTANEPIGDARGRDDYTQDLFGKPVPDEGRSRRNRVEQPAADNRDVLAAKSVPGAKFATITGPRVTDTLKSGFDVVDDAGKAAHVFAGLRRSPQERFAVLILDRNKRPISYVETGAGAVAQVSVYPEVVTKAIYDEPNAAYVWIAHNHPSGMSTPSEADRSITKTLSTAFGPGTGVEMLGHVVLARTDYSQMDGDGGGYYVSRSIPAAARTHEIQIKQRRIQKAGHLGGNISGPEDAMTAAQDIANGKTGVLFLSVQNYPVAFLPMSAARMQKLRDGQSARELFGAVARSNAGRAILYFEPGVGWDDALAAAKNVNDAIGGPRDVNVLDAIYHTEAGHTASMAAQLGTMPGGNSSGTFFSRADRADTGLRIHREDLDAVAARYRAAYPRVPVQVHDTEASAPKALRDDIRKHGAQGDVAGAWHDGTIHLFRSGIENIEHAEFTALHEGAHAGLTALFGPALDMHLMDMHRSNPSLRAEAAQIAKRYGLSQVRATEEALADMGGEAVRLNGWQKLVAFIRNRLRKLGFVREWTDKDIIGLVETAREYNRKAVGTTVFGGARFSRGDEAQTEAGLSLRALRDAYATAEARMADILANDPPDVDTWSSASNAAFDTKAAFVAALSDSNDASFALSGKTSDGRVVTLNASAQQPGKWQLTRFDRAGAPWGDTQYPTKKGAITDFLSEVEPGSVSDFDRALSQSADARYSRQSSLNQQPTNNHLESARRKMSLAPKRSLGERIRAGLGAVVDALKTQRGEYADAMRQGTLDQFYGIKRAEQRTLGNLPAEQSAYVAARLATGSASVMRAVLLHGQPQWAANGQHLEKKAGTVGLLDVLQPVKNELDDWIMWMVGNRAGRLMGEGRENLFTPDEIAALKALAKGREARFKKAADDFAAFKRSILDVAEKAGLLDKTTRPAWDHADWIPFYRQREESGDTLGPRGRRGMAGQSSGIRMLKGGGSALNDPLENIIMNFQHLLDASLKNNAVRKAIAYAKDVTEPVGMDFAAQIVPASEIRRVMHEQGVPDAIIKTIPGAAFEGIRKMWSMQAPNDPDVIRVMVDGKARYFRVRDPLLLRAVTSFQPFDFPGLGAARFFRRLLTASVTATPEFMLRNFIRDTASTAIISRDMVAAAGAFKGMVKAYRETGAAEQMMFAGASFQGGYIDGHDRERTARQLRRALRDKGLDAAVVDSHMASLIDGTASLWEHYKKIGESIENANREAVFEATSRAGKSATEAAYEAKDLMDFSLRGSWAGYQLLADVLPFFNARVQGMYRLGRSNPKALAVRGALMLTVPSLLLALANVGDDRYEELPDWDKDTYWHFFIGGEHFRIPKPFEVGVFFATMPERMVAAIAGDDDGGKFLARAWWNLHEQLNLVDWPQIAKPVIEAWANRNTFTGRDIESMGDERKLPSARYDERTSAFMREVVGGLGPLADATGLSPKKAEHILVGYTGTFGAWGLAAMDAAVREAAGDPARPSLRPDDLPILRVFYRGDDTMPARSTQHVQDVYDGAREYQKVLATAKSKFQEGRSDEGRALLAEPSLKWQAPLSGAAEAISAMNKRADRIMLDTTLSPEQKRAQLDDLLGRRNELARQAVKKSREVRATID